MNESARFIGSLVPIDCETLARHRSIYVYIGYKIIISGGAIKHLLERHLNSSVTPIGYNDVRWSS